MDTRDARSRIRGAADAANAGLILSLVLTAFAIARTLVFLGVVWHAAGGGDFDPAIAQILDGVGGWLRVLQFALAIGVAVFFVRWLVQLAEGLVSFDPTQPRFGRFDLVVSWFIPIFNLVRPYQVMAALWTANASRGAGETDAARAAGTPGPALLRAWWATWVLSGIVLTVLSRIPTTDLDLAGNTIVFGLSGLGQAGRFVAGVLAIRVVTGLTSRAEARLRDVQFEVAQEVGT